MYSENHNAASKELGVSLIYCNKNTVKICQDFSNRSDHLSQQMMKSRKISKKLLLLFCKIIIWKEEIKTPIESINLAPLFN